MPEPTFPDAPIIHLSFDLQPGNVVQCNFQHEGGVLSSFDVAQLPKYLTPLLGDLVVKQADSLATQATEIAGHAAILETKDENMQLALEALDTTARKLAKAEAALTVPVELIEAVGLLPEPKPAEESASAAEEAPVPAAEEPDPAPVKRVRRGNPVIDAMPTADGAK